MTAYERSSRQLVGETRGFTNKETKTKRDLLPHFASMARHAGVGHNKAKTKNILHSSCLRFSFFFPILFLVDCIHRRSGAGCDRREFPTWSRGRFPRLIGISGGCFYFTQQILFRVAEFSLTACADRRTICIVEKPLWACWALTASFKRSRIAASWRVSLHWHQLNLARLRSEDRYTLLLHKD